MTRNGKSSGKQHASQVQRISSKSVRARDRQLLVLAEMPGGVSAHEQAQNRNSHPAEQPFHLRPGEPECGDADRISHPDTPPDPKICLGGAQAGTFRSVSAATSTSSTAIRNIAAE